MGSMRAWVIVWATAALVATAVPETPDAAEAGMPAPLPTTIPIRDIGAPPGSGVTPAPFVPRAAPKKHRRTKPPRKRPAARPATPAPGAPQATQPNPSAPKLEQRYEAPTESIFPLGPEPAPGQNAPQARGQAPAPQPAPAAFPPEPAPAPAPAKP